MAKDLFAFIESDSTSLGSGYVFYERLKDNHLNNYQNLYSTVKSRMNEATNEVMGLKASTARLLSQAQNERQKEIELLRR